VGAIRVSQTDREEVELQEQLLQIQLCSASEEVFLAQLALRARLLNDEFQRKILGVCSQNVGPACQAPTAVGIERLSSAGKGGCEGTEIECLFMEGMSTVEVHTAAPKGLVRMREKLRKYAPPHPRGVWPLCANILDPLRVAVVVAGGPSQILQVIQWFTEHEEENSLPVRRLKNKFSRPEEAVANGYRDVQLGVLFTGSTGLKIIGEIQIHDLELYRLKLKMHKLYKIQRARALDSL